MSTITDWLALLGMTGMVFWLLWLVFGPPRPFISGRASFPFRPAPAELDKTAPFSEAGPRDTHRPAPTGCGEGEEGQACRSPEGERHDIHPGSARPLNAGQPDGWAVVASDGHFVGIWKARDIAEQVANRSPSVKGERVAGMVFAAGEGDANG